jgi:hypothetical protein
MNTKIEEIIGKAEIKKKRELFKKIAHGLNRGLYDPGHK